MIIVLYLDHSAACKLCQGEATRPADMVQLALYYLILAVPLEESSFNGP